MTRTLAIPASLIALLYFSPTVALAQNAPPSYEADPDVYTLIFEDQNFRVIASSRKPGATDKPHSHLVPSVVYFLSDCKSRIHTPDGKTQELNGEQGHAQTVPTTPKHSVENIGRENCDAIFVERK